MAVAHAVTRCCAGLGPRSRSLENETGPRRCQRVQPARCRWSALLVAIVCLFRLPSVAAQDDASVGMVNETQARLTCARPRECEQFLSEDLPCFRLDYAKSWDVAKQVYMC
ncbi:unnamed protein product, partial [Polarella glacialis]